jgi:hypothetical protein
MLTTAHRAGFLRQKSGASIIRHGWEHGALTLAFIRRVDFSETAHPDCADS